MTLFDPFQTQFDSLEEFAERISKGLHCPITIEDANHRLVAYSTHTDDTDVARISTIMSRRVPEKIINSLWKTGVIPQLLRSGEPIRVPDIPEIGLYNRIAISIWKNNDVLGFIWAIETNAWGNEQFLFFKQVAQATTNKLLQLHIRKHRKEEQNQEVFWKLLTGHIISDDHIAEQFQLLQLSVPKNFATVVFRFQETIKEEQQISYLLKTMQQFYIPFYTIDQNELILLIASASPLTVQTLKTFISSFTDKIKECFRIVVKGSFGGIHKQLSLIEKSYKQALSVLATKKKFPDQTETIHGYQELGIYQFFDLLLEQKQLGNFDNPTLEKLQAYDKKHQTTLMETFEVFTDCDNNLNQAAKLLNIHVNTLAYRLKRISEVGEIQINNVHEKMKLYIDLKLIKYGRM